MSGWQPQQYDPAEHQRRVQGGQQPWPPQQQYPPQPPPGYGQPQAYQPPQPPPGPPRRRKSWAERHKVLTGFLALCGLIAVIVIATSSGSPGAPAVTAGATASTPASHAAPAKKTTAVARTVATFSGSGIENTAKFTVGSTWKLDWKYNCSSFGSSGNFIVEEDGGNDFNGASVNELGTGKSGSTMAYDDAGTHYLAVNSECDWTVRVISES